MKKIIFIVLLMIGFHNTTQAQFVVTDPTNLVQSIVNTAQEIIQTSSTASNVINNFKETAKIYKQGKKYYDQLKKVKNLVKDARKVQQAVLMIGDISDSYVNSFQRMLKDENYTPQELTAIAFGYSKLLEESGALVKELKKIVNPSTLSMNDKERMDVIDRVYKEIKNYRDLVNYYTQKNIGISYLRAKKKGDTKRVLALYGTSKERNW